MGVSVNVGEQTNGFIVQRKEKIAEVDAEALFLKHDVSQAELVALLCEDDNKVFMTCFKTPPENDSGVAHILEHSVLNGSAKYPVKEPFAELLKSSLNTFLNAFTYPDRTCYPVASRNHQDFENLMDVYLDAVFHPKLSRETFMQEGWHYELEGDDNELKYSGVVYNEMMGSYSDPDRLLHTELDRLLFPDSIYGVDSGGDPAAIPNLTYEQFKAFHQRLYHPSNSRTVLYGDLKLEQSLAHIDRYLSNFSAIDPKTEIRKQPPLKQGVRHEATYPISADEPTARKTYIVSAWAVPFDIRDPELVLTYSVLSRVLTGTSASPLRKALTDSGLGENTLNYGFQAYTKEPYFTVGFKGSDPDKEEAATKLIVETLEKLVKDGIDERTLESCVNSVEFSLREANYGGYPKGIVYGLNMLIPWLYGGDPLEPLKYEEALLKMKQKLKQGRYFEQLIQDSLLDNPHRVTLVMKPSAEMEPERVEALKQKLSKLKEEQSDAELKRIADDAAKLKEAQGTPDSPEALATLPKLPISCIDKKEEQLHLDLLEDGKLSFSEQKTNGIAYVHAYFDTKAVSPDLLPWLPLYGVLTRQVGSSSRDFVALTQEVDLHTGGVWSDYDCGARADGSISSTMEWGGKALCAKVPELFQLLTEIITACDLKNEKRIREILRMRVNSYRGSILSSGHSYAVSRLGAYSSEVGRLSELTGGLEQYAFLEAELKQFEQDPSQVLEKLQRLHSQVLSKEALHFHVTGSGAELKAVQQAKARLLDALPEKAGPAAARDLPKLVENEAFKVPSKVQYVAKGLNLSELGVTYDGSMEVLMRILSRDYLWNKVRVEGNAYGCFGQLERLSGNFSMVSYRDPHLQRTLSVYDQTADYFKELDWSDERFESVLIGTMGGLDKPLSPDTRGERAWIRKERGVTQESLQERRDQLLSTTKKSLTERVEWLAEFAKKGRLCVVGGAEAIDEQAELFERVETVFAGD